jgi:hypothetical protein
MGRPYSPQTLGERWGCSPQKIRTMCRSGELASFTLGKLIRIPASEVERIECQSSTASEDTAESSSSNMETLLGDDFAARLARQIEGSQRPVLVSSGPRSQPLQRNG